eukprot:GEMP01037451.1.p1 GENE.GEMP01037451.1~~GEMP01037451.1.p1  ORF type:complete len:398 (+),score=36.11 GEMP01037451.1:496-1689(+)
MMVVAKTPFHARYVRLAEYFLGVRWSRLTTFFLVSSLMVTNIASIIVSAQVVDQFLIRVLDETCGLEVTSFSWVCSSEVIGNSPFQTAVITKGFLFCLALAVPLGILNLEDNMIIQIIATFICFFCIAYWMWGFYPNAEIASFVDKHMWGTTYTAVLGPAIANFSFVVTVPSWCNEKVPSVNINRTLWGSISICVVTYVVFGIVAAATFGNRLSEKVDFLSLIQNGKNAGLIEVLTCQLFPLMAGLLGVPVASIICRYNLLQSGMIKRKVTSNLVAVVLPWAISFPCQTLGNGLALPALMNWGSLIFGSVCNFIIPTIIYTAYQRRTTRISAQSLTVGLMHNEVLTVLNETLEMNASEHWSLPGQRQDRWKYHFGYAMTIFMVVLVTYSIYSQLVSL